MKPTTRRARRGPSEEEMYRRFSEVFDLRALALEYNDRTGAMLCDVAEKTFQPRQRDFEAMLAAHPATAAEETVVGVVLVLVFIAWLLS